MKATIPATREGLVDANGRINPSWYRFLTQLMRDVSNSGPSADTKLPPYTVATVPSAATKGAGTLIYVSDEAGGATMAFSDGTNWRRVQDRVVIS